VITAALPHALDRRVQIRATPDVVFRFFTDSARWAAWWGAGSTIDARVGGRVLIRYPDGTEAAGEVLEVAPPMRLVFTYGYVKGTPIPAGSSKVTIVLTSDAAGTRLALTHEFADAAVRDEHVQGWRYQLALFSNLVAAEVNAGAESRVDAWFGAWSITDAAARAEALAAVAAPSIEFRDRFSAVEGLDDLSAHIAGAQRFMRDVHLRRSGAVRQCHGTVLAEWTAASSDGQPRGAGTNVFAFGPDGKIAAVTGFWN